MSQFLDEMAKEKAMNLLIKFHPGLFDVPKITDCKKYALICVDEMINCCSDIYDKEFMEKVKTQLEKL